MHYFPSIRHYWKYGALMFLAILFVTCFSLSTSPLWSYPNINDSYVFLVIGKYWAQGCLPYVDFWELKGPIIFAIDALGYLLTGTRIGVYLIQILFLCLTVLAMYRFYNRYMAHRFVLLCLVFSLLCLFGVYEDGNMVEEYALPFLVLSWSFQYKWVNDVMDRGIYEHVPWQAAFYGFFFAFCLLTRLTNALGLCGGVALIAILLLIHGKYKNLLYNILAFLGGFSLLVIPFAFYFYSKGALYDMWYGTFLFNLQYAESSSHGIHLFFRSYIDVYACLMMGGITILLSKKRRLLGLWMVMISMFLLLWLTRSYGFRHYDMVAVPYSCIVFVEAYRFFQEQKSSLLRWLPVLVLSVYGLMVITKDITVLRHNMPPLLKSIEHKEDVLMAQIPQEERNAFTVYNTTPYCYLKYDIKPCYKYFAPLDFILGMNNELHDQVLESFNTCKARWMIVCRQEGEVFHIKPLLQDRYTLVDTHEDFYLYKLKE